MSAFHKSMLAIPLIHEEIQLHQQKKGFLSLEVNGNLVKGVEDIKVIVEYFQKQFSARKSSLSLVNLDFKRISG